MLYIIYSKNKELGMIEEDNLEKAQKTANKLFPTWTDIYLKEYKEK